MPAGEEAPLDVGLGLWGMQATRIVPRYHCARVRWNSLPRPDVHRCVRLLGEEVVPALRGRRT